MLKTLFLRLFFVVLFVGAAADSNVDKFCYEARTEGECFEYVREAAEQENANAQYILGKMYLNGDVVEKDKQEALLWFRLAAEQGNVKAQYVLDVHESAEKGDVVAQNNLDDIRKNAEQGDAEAQFLLGWLHRDGLGVDEDKHKAVGWFLLAAEQGNMLAQYNLGQMYYTGDGVDEDKSEAARWFRLAAEQGDAKAQHNLDVINNAESVPLSKSNITFIAKTLILLAIFLFFIWRYSTSKVTTTGSGTMPNHSWRDTDEDDIIALSAYLSTLKGVSKTNANTIGTNLINRRSRRDGVVGVKSIRRKMTNIEHLDKLDKGGIRGGEHASDTNKRIFAEYRNAPDKLAKRMAEIIATLPKEKK